jgi:apolipoprotein N-acyltransferase
LPSFAPLICYEAYFPEDVVLKEQLPDFIVNFTNDAWYGNTSGPYQHLYMTKLRAIEQGIPIARAANTGISAIIDPYGRILKMLPLNKEGIIDLQLPKALKTTTIYSKYLNSIVFAIIPIFFLICSQSINKLTKFGSKSQ